MNRFTLPTHVAAALLSIHAPVVNTDQYQRLVRIATPLVAKGRGLYEVERIVRKRVIRRGYVSGMRSAREHAADLALQAVCDACGAAGRMNDFEADDWTKI